MAVKLDEIRSAAARVAASHGLDVVDLEFIGPAKERTLRIFLEKNAEGRARFKAAIAAGEGVEELPESLMEGTLSVEQLSASHMKTVPHSARLWRFAGRGRFDSRRGVHAGSKFSRFGSETVQGGGVSEVHGSLVKIQTFEPIRNNRHWQGRLVASAAGTVTLDLNAVKQNSKSRKAGVSTVEIALGNIEKAQLVPEI